jgi:hypothetical protein
MQSILRALLGGICLFSLVAACGSDAGPSPGMGSSTLGDSAPGATTIGGGTVNAASPNAGSLSIVESASQTATTNDTTTETAIPASVSMTTGPSATAAATLAASASNSVTTPAVTQLTKAIENLGTTSAGQAASGLGFNVEPSNDWEFQMAAAAGATSVRFQCGWATTETQSAPPANTNGSTKFVLQAGCQSGLISAQRYGLKPTVLAAYGSPYHAILQVSLPTGASAGSTQLKISLLSGIGGDTLNQIAFPNDTIIATSGNQISQLHSYAGTLITGVTLTGPTTATLTLASALTSSLPASSSTSYTINEYLHAPAASFSPTDPSNIAFAAYAEFLAQSVQDASLQGEIEIWNEPPWPDDPWDDRADFYDSAPATSSAVILAPPYMPNFGFVAAIQAQTARYNGVNFVWGGTEKSGASSLFNWMQGDTGVALAQPVQAVTTESIHPYGNSPEDSLWIESCLKGTILPYPAGPTPFSVCNLNGVPGGNASLGEQFSLRQQSRNSTWGVRREITETGFPATSGDGLHKARFITRQFLGYEAAGVTPIEFYRLFDTSSFNWGFVSQTASTDGSHAPNAAYEAISGLVSDLKSISAIAPVSALSAILPQITQYSGTYPLDEVTFLGAQSGATSDSFLMALWQRSDSTNWGTLVSPVLASVTVTIPPNMVVKSVLNIDTRGTVGYSQAGLALTLQVSDDPVEILLVPAIASSTL